MHFFLPLVHSLVQRERKNVWLGERPFMALNIDGRNRGKSQIIVIKGYFVKNPIFRLIKISPGLNLFTSLPQWSNPIYFRPPALHNNPPESRPEQIHGKYYLSVPPVICTELFILKEERKAPS